MFRIGITSGLLLLLAAAAHAQTQVQQQPTGVEDIRRGLTDGAAAGRHTSLLLPLTFTIGTAAVLSATDGAELTNNHIVAALVANTAISAGVSFLSHKLLKPRPNRDQREALAQQSALYANAWRRGFNDASSNRRFVASAVGVLGGAVLAAVIYSVRAE